MHRIELMIVKLMYTNAGNQDREQQQRKLWF